MPDPLHGQVTLTTSAQRLAQPSVEVSAFEIKAPSSNAAVVYLGGSSVTSSNGFIIEPGDEFSYERLQQNGQPVYQLRPSDFYVVGTASDKISWIASPS